MKSYDLVKMAGGNLIRHKLRTTLTVLGIVIGSISIILMVALGLGLQDSINSEFAGFNSVDVIQVYKGNNVSDQSRLAEVQSFERLDDLDLEYFESIEGVKFATPAIRSYGKFISGQYEVTASLVGVDPSVMSEIGIDLESGRYLEETDAYAAVFGQQAIDNFSQAFANNNQLLRQVEEEETEEMDFSLFGLNEVYKDFDVDVMVDRLQFTMDTQYSVQAGKTLTDFDVYSVDGVGIIESGDVTQDDLIFMTFDTVKSIMDDYHRRVGIPPRTDYDSAYVKVSNIEDVKRINETIQSRGYQTFAIADILDSIESTLMVMQVALGAIGGISLLVAAIGITNTMVMAITERKKEIGIMKVIGATLKDIQRLFLLEAAMIGTVGGVIGIGFSVGISAIISSSWFNAALAGGEASGGGPAFSFSIPTWLIISGLGFTTAVGIISGFIPALKAMKSSALEALRNE